MILEILRTHKNKKLRKEYIDCAMVVMNEVQLTGQLHMDICYRDTWVSRNLELINDESISCSLLSDSGSRIELISKFGGEEKL